MKEGQAAIDWLENESFDSEYNRSSPSTPDMPEGFFSIKEDQCMCFGDIHDDAGIYSWTQTLAPEHYRKSDLDPNAWKLSSPA